MKRTAFLLLASFPYVFNAYADGLSVTITDPAYGAVCDGQTGHTYPAPCDDPPAPDDMCAINHALDAVGAAGGGEVIFPLGTCIVSPRQEPSPPDVDPTAYLHLYSDLTIRGAGPKSVLKVSDASASAGYGRIFSARTLLTNVVIKDFRIDQNPSPACVRPDPLSDAGRYGIAPGEPVHGLTISGMFFDPTDSPNTIFVANREPNPPDLDATITNHYFYFFKNCPPGSRWYDVSTMSIEGSQQVIRNNTFTSPNTDQLAHTAIETLGGRSIIADNSMNNYAIAVLLVPSYYACSAATCAAELNPSDVVIANNTATCASGAISIWPTTGTTLRNVSITGNILHICNAERYAGSTAAIATAWSSDLDQPPGTRGYQGDLDGLTISDNVIIMQKDTRAYDFPSGYELTAGILLRQVGNLSNVLIKGNVIKDAPLSGIRIGPDDYQPYLPSHTVQHLRIVDNIIVDAGNNPIPGGPSGKDYVRHAIGVVDFVNDVEVMDNMIYDTGSSAPFGKYALYLQPYSPSTNVRTARNAVRLNSANGQLLSPQSSIGQMDSTAGGGVQVSSVVGGSPLAPPSFNVDFTSFPRYVTTITSPAGGGSSPLTIKVSAPPAVSNGKQFTNGQVVTFRFLCANPGDGGCSVKFDDAYATAGDLGTGSNPIATGMARSISFQVELRDSGSASRYFFELFRTGDVPNG